MAEHTINVASIAQIAYEHGGETLVIDTHDDRYFIEFGSATTQAHFLEATLAATLDRIARLQSGIGTLDTFTEALR